jgi:hypothetical protein
MKINFFRAVVVRVALATRTIERKAKLKVARDIERAKHLDKKIDRVVGGKPSPRFVSCFESMKVEFEIANWKKFKD